MKAVVGWEAPQQAKPLTHCLVGRLRGEGEEKKGLSPDRFWEGHESPTSLCPAPFPIDDMPLTISWQQDVEGEQPF